jgi:hypothetical protein
LVGSEAQLMTFTERDGHFREGRPVRPHSMHIGDRERDIQDALDQQEMRHLERTLDNAAADFRDYPSNMTVRSLYAARETRDAFRDQLRDARHRELGID